MTWNAANHGLCDVELFLMFVQNDNSTQNVTVPVADQSYDVNCSLLMNVKSVRYKTIVMYNNTIPTYNNENDNENELSEEITLEKMTTTTTTTTTTSKLNKFIYIDLILKTI